MKEIKVSVQIKVKDMFHFQMRHVYTSISGLFGVLVSLAALFLLIVNWGKLEGTTLILMAFVAAMFTVIQPVRLYSKAVQSVKLNPMFQKPLDYTFCESGMIVEQEEQRLELNWGQIYRVIANKKGIQIYLDKIRGYILPAEQLDGRMDEIVAFIREQQEKYKEEQKNAPAPESVQTEAAAPEKASVRRSIRDLASMNTEELDGPKEEQDDN